MKKSLIIYYFSTEMRYGSSLIFLGSIYCVFQFYFLLAFLTMLVGFSIVTARYVTIIDNGNRNIIDYFSIIGLKLNNEEIPYTSLQQIIITKENKGYSANSRSRERQVKWSQYDAILIYNSQQSFKLLSENSKISLILKLEDIIHLLELPVEDRTTNAPYTINTEAIFGNKENT